MPDRRPGRAWPGHASSRAGRAGWRNAASRAGRADARGAASRAGRADARGVGSRAGRAAARGVGSQDGDAGWREPGSQDGRDHRLGPIGRAAPAPPVGPRLDSGFAAARSRSRRWLLVIVVGIIAALLAGASVTLVSTSSGSGRAAPAGGDRFRGDVKPCGIVGAPRLPDPAAQHPTPRRAHDRQDTAVPDPDRVGHWNVRPVTHNRRRAGGRSPGSRAHWHPLLPGRHRHARFRGAEY
jgi:hypothetical protein